VIIVKVKRAVAEGQETIEEIELPQGHDMELSQSEANILVWNDEGEESELVAIIPMMNVVGVVKTGR
jgi:hypothetical protein